MVEITDEYIEWNEKYKERFGEFVPLAMIPQIETTDGIIEKIKKCLEADRDLLPEIYKWKFDGSEIY